MKRLAFHVTGRVQGVGYRRFVERQAQAFAIAGFVRNEADGTVTGEAEGHDAAIEEFVDGLRRGPAFARVDEVELEPRACTGDSGFLVRR
jgi:acylphosphatase